MTYFLFLISLLVISSWTYNSSIEYHFEQIPVNIQEKNGILKGKIELPSKALREIKRKRRSRRYSRRDLDLAKKATAFNEYQKSMIYLIPFDKSNYKQRTEIVIMEQKNVSFEPALMVIQTGQKINFVNKDNIFHNVFSTDKAKRFNIGKKPRNVAVPVEFEEKGDVQVFCDIHAFMSAYIKVVETPYFTTVNEDATFEIKDIPEGKYAIVGWHSRATFKPDLIEIKSNRITKINELVFQ
jgi:plastocyanin